MIWSSHISYKEFYNKDDFPKHLPHLRHIYDDLFVGGKKMRARLVQSLGHCLLLTDEQKHLLSQSVEFTHNASLLHDDFLDRASLRRGKTVAWKKYSPEFAVLAGDYLLARVMVSLSRYGSLKLVSYTAQVVSELLEGEWLQNTFENCTNVSLEDISQVDYLKTGSLFRWCLLTPFMLSLPEWEKVKTPLEKMGSILGTLFQRSDDLLDFDVRNHENKALLTDLKHGYLNSFSAFALSQLSGEKNTVREKIFSCKTMEDIYKLIPQNQWTELIKKFDLMNEKLMTSYFEYLDIVLQEVKNSSKSNSPKTKSYDHEGLEKNLRLLPSLLYWRELRV